MPALMMGVMVAGGVMSSMGQADAAATQAANQMAAFRQNEMNRGKEWANQSWFQVLQQAQRWATNKAIVKDALSTREKNKYWERTRLDNTRSTMSKNMVKGYNDLTAVLGGRLGTNSATSRALLKSTMQNYHQARQTQNVNLALKDRAYDDQYQKAINKRDFGFTPVGEFNLNQYYGADPSDVYKSTLMQGLGQTAMSAGGAAMNFNASGGSWTGTTT